MGCRAPEPGWHRARWRRRERRRRRRRVRIQRRSRSGRQLADDENATGLDRFRFLPGAGQVAKHTPAHVLDVLRSFAQVRVGELAIDVRHGGGGLAPRAGGLAALGDRRPGGAEQRGVVEQEEVGVEHGGRVLGLPSRRGGAAPPRRRLEPRREPPRAERALPPASRRGRRARPGRRARSRCRTEPVARVRSRCPRIPVARSAGRRRAAANRKQARSAELPWEHPRPAPVRPRRGRRSRRRRRPALAARRAPPRPAAPGRGRARCGLDGPTG
jgi:hypothetical protein